MPDFLDREATAEDTELLGALQQLPPHRTPPGMIVAFRRRVVREHGRRIGWPVVAAGIAAMLFVISTGAWWHDHQMLSRQAVESHDQLNLALQSISAGARLDAINATVRSGRHGDAVEQALIKALLDDPNTSVRIAAADALGKVARPSVLGQAVRRSLAAENSPFVQASLLNSIGQLPISERRAAITPLLVRGDVDPMIMNDARERTSEPVKRDSR